MSRTLSVVVLLLGASLAGCLGDPEDLAPETVETPEADVAGDAVVIAVIDSGINPYHWDFSAHLMPQHLNDDPSDDLPLDEDPATWLPGHPGADAFASYQALGITLNTTDPDARVSNTVECDFRFVVTTGCRDTGDGLYENDADVWKNVSRSSAGEINMHWFPGTKVVGYVNFGQGDGFAATSHGVDSASVAVGNLHGTCPECLFVFVNGLGEAANEWVAEQDWIDAQTNSWGRSFLVRDRLYAGSDVEQQREAVERGQSIFFSAGNGQANTFTVPNPTLWSSQEGPDWIITVGAITSDSHDSYSGHGKPADLASVGDAYPSAGGGNVSGEGTHSGTSSATPTTAGVFGRALYEVRRAMDGASRVQAEGVVAVGNATCGDANPDCAVADGRVTVHELRASLFAGAEYLAEGWSLSFTGLTIPHTSTDMRFMAEGHGSFLGHLAPEGFEAESARVADHVLGAWREDPDPDQVAWMTAASYCRQSLWGPWSHGYWNDDATLPQADPMHPVRTWLVEECPRTGKAVRDVVGIVNGD